MSAPRRDEDAELDAALAAYPLRPTPPGLARTVLTRVRGLAARPRFRLSWLDLALPAFGGAMVGLLLLLAALATPQTVARAQSTLGLVLGSGGPQNATVVLVALAAAGAVALGVVGVAGVALLVNSGRR